MVAARPAPNDDTSATRDRVGVCCPKLPERARSVQRLCGKLAPLHELVSYATRATLSALDTHLGDSYNPTTQTRRPRRASRKNQGCRA
jgi:hypothetical protein